ncbi:hypothetical protein ART_2147 [Arthrobacter sp. PAMC 25486]|nr:hypothetical protein ART_2147 [Arthrobacter sp. PAMC 25486]
MIVNRVKLASTAELFPSLVLITMNNLQPEGRSFQTDFKA